MGTARMHLHEKEIEIDGVKMREVRKLNPDGHQTSVLTTKIKKTREKIARKKGIYNFGELFFTE